MADDTDQLVEMLTYKSVGYHGTTAAAAQKIAATGKLIASDGKAEWLGHGIYFWERSSDKAWDWARKNHPDEEIAVLGAIINLERGLDLCDLKDSRFLQGILDDLKETGLSSVFPTNNPPKRYHPLDCLLVNYACAALRKQGVKIATLRAPFLEGDPLFTEEGRSSVLRLHSHVQIAVRDPATVEDLWVEIA